MIKMLKEEMKINKNLIDMNKREKELKKIFEEYKIVKGEDGYPITTLKVGDIVLDDLTGKVFKISHKIKKKNDEWQGSWIIFNSDFKDARHEWEVNKLEKINKGSKV